MKHFRAWWAQFFAGAQARICLRCRHWLRYDPGVEPFGDCALDRSQRCANETCAEFAKKAASVTRRGEITILAVLCLSVALNGVLAIMARGGFHNRSAMSTIAVSGTNVTVQVYQDIRPNGGGSLEVPLSQKAKAAEQTAQ
jgi:hypothetical protein